MVVIFKFKVLTYFDDSKNKDGFYEPKYSEFLGDVLFTETRQDISEGGKTQTTTYSFHEYERTADVFSRIMMDKYPKYNSQNGKPLRDFIEIDGEKNCYIRWWRKIIWELQKSAYNTAFGGSQGGKDVTVANTSTQELFTIPKNMLQEKFRETLLTQIPLKVIIDGRYQVIMFYMAAQKKSQNLVRSVRSQET